MENKLFEKLFAAPAAGRGGSWAAARPEGLRDVTRIAVAAASPGAGASFVSGLLAAELRQKGRVTLTELGSPYFYSALGMEKRFYAKPFAFYSSLMENGKPLKTVRNIDGDINWALKAPKEPANAGEINVFRAFSNLPGDYLVCDCSGLEPEAALHIMTEADVSFAVVDPMPTRLFEAFDFMEKLRLTLPGAVLAVNKMNDGVRRSELKNFLGTGNCIFIPALAPEIFYRAEYSCMLPSEIPEGAEELCDSVTELVSRIV